MRVAIAQSKTHNHDSIPAPVELLRTCLATRTKSHDTEMGEMVLAFGRFSPFHKVLQSSLGLVVG